MNGPSVDPALQDAATQDLAAPAPAPLMDPSNLDAQVQKINGVERAWNLPALPNEVKLDLLTHPALPTAADVGGFLWNIHSAMQDAAKPVNIAAQVAPTAPLQTLGGVTPQPTPDPLSTPALPQDTSFAPADDPGNQLRRIWHGIAGLQAPEIITPNATQDIKLRAIQQGLLPSNTPIDGSWDPEMQHVASQLQYQDFSDRILGSRPGSERTSNALELLDRWTNPSSLTAAATALGFIPDLKAIQGNVDDWNKDHNPLDLFKAGLNIALPVVNDVLLFTGVSEVVGFGRAALMSREALAGLDAANEVARGGGLLARLAPDALGAAADVENFGKPGWIGGRLAERGGVLGTAGDAMNAWRQNTGVMLAKKAVQQSMKLGFIGQAESTIFPDLGGIGFGGTGTQGQRIAERQRSFNANPVTQTLGMALSLPLAPPNLFKQGTFTGPATSIVNHLKRAVTDVSRDSAITNVYHELLMAELPARDPEAFAKYQAAVQRSGPRDALVAYLGDGDEARAGEIMTHLTLTAAVNRMAENNVTALGLNRFDDGIRYDEAYHMYRNNFINKLRPVQDLDLTNPDDVARFAELRSNTQWTDVQNPEGRDGLKAMRRQRTQIADDVTSSLLSEDPAVRDQAIADGQAAIAHHNGVTRNETLNFLLAEPFGAEHIADQLSKTWDRVSPDRWDDFTGSIARLREASATGDLKFVDARNPGDWRPGTFVDHMPTWIDPKDLGKTKGLTSFGGDPDPLRGQFTVMRDTELTRQDAAGVIGYAKTLLERQKSLRLNKDGLDETFDRVRPILATLGGGDAGAVTDDAVNAGVQALATMKRSDAKTAVRDAITSVTDPAALGQIPKDFAGQYLDTLRWVAKQGGDATRAADHIGEQLTALDRASFWANSNLAIGAMPLEQKVKALGGRLRYIAGGVQVDPETEAALAAKGYKAVYGTDFLFPTDLVGLNGPLGELHRSTMRKVSLGRFLSSQDDNISKLREIAFRRNLGQMPADVTPGYNYSAGEHPWAPDSADVEDIVGRLFTKSNDIRAAGQMADAQRSGGVLGNVSTALMNSTQPHSIYDFNVGTIRDLFEETYGPKGASFIANSLKDARHLGWEYEGLGAIESRLRANSWLQGTLKVLGKTESGQALNEWTGFKRAGVGALSGALALAQGAGVPQAAAIGGASAALYGEPTPLRRAATGAALAGAAGLATGGDPLSMAGAAAIGGLGGSSSAILNPRFALGAVAAGVAGRAAQSAGASPLESLGIGVGAGVLGAKGTAVGARKLLDIASSRDWAQYSKIGDRLAQVRDQVRFSLNPIFDLRRVAKSALRGAIADVPEGVHVPINHSLGHFAEGEQGEILDRFKAATNPWYNAEAVDEMARFSADRGILGFSPTRDMAGMFGHLVNQGVDDATAANLVRKTLTYGGRTGLEKSVNFVFFPFSFEKKVMGQLAQFMSHDLGRTVLVHDAVKAYDVLNDRYDLSSKLEDHAPILTELSKLNMFTNGLSLGELGGVNRPLLEAAQASPLGNVVDPVLNAFLPQGLQIDPGTDTGNLQRIVSRMVPAYRDMSNLLDDAAQQGHVLFSSSHMVDGAETREAYSQWNDFKKGVETFAQQNGATWDQFMRSPKYANIKAYIEQERADIGRKFPAWADARAKAAANATALQNELTDITVRPHTPAEGQLAQFADLVDALDSGFRKTYGVSFKNTPDSVPPQAYDSIRQIALGMARQGEGFAQLYNRFYAPMFGPLQETITG